LVSPTKVEAEMLWKYGKLYSIKISSS